LNLVLNVLPELIAVLASFALSVASVISKGALRHAPPFTGAVMFALVPLILLGPWVSFLVPSGAGTREGFFWFLLSGVIHPGLAITFLLLGNRRVGISRTATMCGMAPLISGLIGVFFLGERPDWTVWLGGLLIVGGVVTISGEKSGDRFKRKDFLFPVLAGLALGVTPVLRKLGLMHVPFPIYGVVTAALGGVLGLSAMARFFPRGERLRLAPKGLLFFGWAASFALAGRLLFFDALNRGEFSRVVFLIHTMPLWVLLLSWLLLRESERITSRLVAATVVVVLGIGVISMGV